MTVTGRLLASATVEGRALPTYTVDTPPTGTAAGSKQIEYRIVLANTHATEDAVFNLRMPAPRGALITTWDGTIVGDTGSTSVVSPDTAIASGMNFDFTLEPNTSVTYTYTVTLLDGYAGVVVVSAQIGWPGIPRTEGFHSPLVMVGTPVEPVSHDDSVDLPQLLSQFFPSSDQRAKALRFKALTSTGRDLIDYLEMVETLMGTFAGLANATTEADLLVRANALAIAFPKP